MLVKTMSIDLNPEQAEQKHCISCKKLFLINILKDDLCPECYKLSMGDIENEKSAEQ
jgi:hypothetical protein